MLFNALSHHRSVRDTFVDGQVLINRARGSGEVVRRANCYVERGDSLIGSLTA